MKLSELVERFPEKKVCNGCGKTMSTSEIKEGNFISCCPDGKCSEHKHNEIINACDKEVMVDEAGFNSIITEDKLYKWIWIDRLGMSQIRNLIFEAIAQNIKGILKVKNEMV